MGPQLGRHRDLDRARGIDKTERMRGAAGWDHPQLIGALLLSGNQRGRHDRDAAVGGIGRGEEPGLARRLVEPRRSAAARARQLSHIDEGGDARGREPGEDCGGAPEGNSATGRSPPGAVAASWPRCGATLRPAAPRAPRPRRARPRRASQNATSAAKSGSRSSVARRRGAHRRQARQARIRRRANRDPRPRLWCDRRSSLQTRSQFQQPAPDPTLHGPERHLGFAGKLVIGQPVEKRRSDRRRLTILKLLEAML